MDSRAKQRLTGAVILVALFVLLVPELLTGPSDAVAPGAPAEEGMRRYTIDLDAANPSAPPGDSSPTQPAVALPQPASGPELAKPGEAAAPAEPAPATATATASPVAVTPPPVVAQQPPADKPAPRVEAVKPAPAAPAVPGSFAVQLGSFGDRDNADRLVRDMSAKGFAAFVAPIRSGGRDLYRVRVGPTRDRAQAEALAAQLRRAGQSGAVVPIS